MTYGSADIASEIIEFCSTPRTRQELAEDFGFGSSLYFIRHYVAPLVKEGKLKETIPNAPKSKKQMYVSVELRAKL